VEEKIKELSSGMACGRCFEKAEEDLRELMALARKTLI
jgi:hypothetical protein